MEIFDIFQRLAVALAIGLLVGTERGWKEREDPEGSRTAGMRTFALSGLLGAFWGIITSRYGDAGLIALAMVFTTFTVVILVFRYLEAVDQKDFGATTVIAALIVFALGAYTMTGSMVVAAAGGVVTVALLAAKSIMHNWLKRLTWEELRSGIVLLAMTFILLPILPDTLMGPFSIFNPRELWLMTILIAAVSFAGYIAVKLAGEKNGIIFSGIAGGLVSSTAITVNFSRLARIHGDRQNLFIAGIILSGATMMLRVTAVAAIFNLKLLQWLLPFLGTSAIFMIIAGLVLSGRRFYAAIGQDRLVLGNPFSFVTVLQFGALLAFILVLSKLLSAVVGTNALYLFSAVSGLGDVDAITLTMSRLGKTELPVQAASIAILIAVVSNTLVKGGIGWFIAGSRTGLKLTVISLLALGAGYGMMNYAASAGFNMEFLTSPGWLQK